MRLPVSTKAVAMIVEAAPLLQVSGSAEKPFGSLQGVGIHTTGKHFTARRHDGVVSPRQSSDAVQQNDHVLLVLEQTFGLLDHHFRYLDVALGRLVERWN